MDVGINRFRSIPSIFSITKGNNKFEFYTNAFDEFSFEELNDEFEENPNIPNITNDHLEDETIRPCINKAYWKLRSEKSSTDGYIILVMGYARSPFRDFESYLRIVVGSDKDDIQLILKQYNANYVTYELVSGNFTTEDLQEAVYPPGDHEGTLQIEYDDSDKKTKPFLTHSGSTLGMLIFDEKCFIHSSLKFKSYWDYKPTNAIQNNSAGVYTNDKSF